MKPLLRYSLLAGGALLVLASVPWVIGSTLPAEHSVTFSTELDAEPEGVWAVLTNPAAFPEWRPDVTEVAVLSEEDGFPDRWREVTDEGALTFQRVDARPPELLVVEIADEGLPFGGTWSYRLEAVPAGTRLSITEDGVVHSPLFRFFSHFVFGNEATVLAFLEAVEARVGEEPRESR